MAKKNSLKQQAEEVLRIATEHGVEQNFFFITTFERYQVQLQILDDLEKQIKDDGAQFYGALHSLVVRLLWEQNVGGSNPSAPTKFSRVQKDDSPRHVRYSPIRIGGDEHSKLFLMLLFFGCHASASMKIDSSFSIASSKLSAAPSVCGSSGSCLIA